MISYLYFPKAVGQVTYFLLSIRIVARLSGDISAIVQPQAILIFPCSLIILKMFKKPLTHQSNATPIRSSARRQLLSAILEQYPSLLPQDGMDDNNKKELSKLILPEGVRTATFETSTGLEGVCNARSSMI